MSTLLGGGLVVPEFGKADLLTVAQAATSIGWSRRTIYRLIKERKVNAVRLGSGQGQWYVNRRSLRDYVETGNHEPEMSTVFPQQRSGFPMEDGMNRCL